MEDEFMDDLNILRQMRYERECNQRYLFCPNTYKARHAERYQKLHCFLETDYYYTDTEFKEHFRVCHEMFWAIHNRISMDSMFHITRKQGSAALHLLVLLKFLGSNGNEATISKLGQFFGLSKGGFALHLERMMVVLLKRKDKALFWPGPEERKEIAARIEDKHAFPNCVGLIDGTLLPLEIKPSRNGDFSELS